MLVPYSSTVLRQLITCVGPAYPCCISRRNLPCAPFACNMHNCDATSMSLNAKRAVILTALRVEYMAVRTFLGRHSLKEYTHSSGTIYESGIFRGTKTSWNVHLTEIGSGNTIA